MKNWSFVLLHIKFVDSSSLVCIEVYVYLSTPATYVVFLRGLFFSLPTEGLTPVVSAQVYIAVKCDPSAGRGEKQRGSIFWPAGTGIFESVMAATSVVVLDRGNNTTCTINLHGATVVSWRVNNQEQLFVSKQAVFDGKKAIRGGIPFVFPQFGPWTFGPQHGFARIFRWNLEKAPERLASGDVEAIFSMMDTDFTCSMWNYQFRLTYRLILREKELHFNIAVYNPSKDLTFSFNMLLHTYFKVPDVRRCQITGLQGCTFIDKTRDGTVYQETRDVVTIGEWTDRIYQNTPQEHIITNVVSGRKMRIQKYNFPDTVIWNPWIDQAKEMSDFGDDEYPNMVCVEAGHVSSPVILLPGTAFEASQILQVM